MKIRMPENPTLILMVGLPYSGKSTLAQTTRYPIVCPDAIRLAVHLAMDRQWFAREAEDLVQTTTKNMVWSLFLAGHPTVILDACAIRREHRDAWRRSDMPWRTLVCPLTTDVETCLRRATEAGDTEILAAIRKMTATAEPPAEDEARVDLRNGKMVVSIEELEAILQAPEVTP